MLALIDGCAVDDQVAFAPATELPDERRDSLAGTIIPVVTEADIFDCVLETVPPVWFTAVSVTEFNREKATVLKSRAPDLILET